MKENLKNEIKDIIRNCAESYSCVDLDSAVESIIVAIKEEGWKSPEDLKEKWDASEHYK